MEKERCLWEPHPPLTTIDPEWSQDARQKLQKVLERWSYDCETLQIVDMVLSTKELSWEVLFAIEGGIGVPQYRHEQILWWEDVFSASSKEDLPLSPAEALVREAERVSQGLGDTALLEMLKSLFVSYDEHRTVGFLSSAWGILCGLIWEFSHHPEWPKAIDERMSADIAAYTVHTYGKPSKERYDPLTEHRALPAPGCKAQILLHLLAEEWILHFASHFSIEMMDPAECMREDPTTHCMRPLLDMRVYIRPKQALPLSYHTMWNILDKGEAKKRPTFPQQGAKIAIVGAGPSGNVAAHHLKSLGYDVIIFDAKKEEPVREWPVCGPVQSMSCRALSDTLSMRLRPMEGASLSVQDHAAVSALYTHVVALRNTSWGKEATIRQWSTADGGLDASTLLWCKARGVEQGFHALVPTLQKMGWEGVEQVPAAVGLRVVDTVLQGWDTMTDVLNGMEELADDRVRGIWAPVGGWSAWLKSLSVPVEWGHRVVRVDRSKDLVAVELEDHSVASFDVVLLTCPLASSLHLLATPLEEEQLLFPRIRPGVQWIESVSSADMAVGYYERLDALQGLQHVYFLPAAISGGHPVDAMAGALALCQQWLNPLYIAPERPLVHARARRAERRGLAPRPLPALEKGFYSSVTEFPTLGHMFLSRCRENGNKKYVVWCNGEGKEIGELRYDTLLQATASVANHMMETWGMIPGDRVLLVYPPGLEIMPALWACYCTGMVAIPAPPPDPSNMAPGLRTLCHIAADAGAKYAMTSSLYWRATSVASAAAAVRQAIVSPFDALQRLWGKQKETRTSPLYSNAREGQTRRGWPNVEWCSSDRLPLSSSPLSELEEWLEENEVTGDTIALLQYTSGSTSNPRGVVLRHRNVLANCQLMRMCGANDRGIGVSWMPHWHDFGLTALIMNCMVGRSFGIGISPLDFLRRPRLWLELTSKYKATYLMGPDFGMLHCVRKVCYYWKGNILNQIRDLSGLDLSTVRHVCSGGECVRTSTVMSFARKFYNVGFRVGSWTNSWGMAEMVVCANATWRGLSHQGEAPLIITVDRQRLEVEGRVCPVRSDRKDSSTFISSNAPDDYFDVHILVVDPDTGLPCPEGLAGELWVAGPSCSDGYWQHSKEENAKRFAAIPHGMPSPPLQRYLRTGDLGFRWAGELFVYGRMKDLIILAGRNVAPQDVEETCVRAAPNMVRPGCLAAFGCEMDGVERVVVVMEVRCKKEEMQATARLASGVLARDLSVTPAAIAMIAPRSIPKTTSGKVKRQLVRHMWLDKSLALEHVEWFTVSKEPVKQDKVTTDSKDTKDPEAILEWLLKELEQVAGHAVGANDPLMTVVPDSATAVGLAGDLSRAVGREVPVVTFYAHPTPRSLAHYLAGVASSSDDQLPLPLSISNTEPLAIVGMACRLAGGISTLEQYWDALVAGADLTVPLVRRMPGLTQENAKGALMDESMVSGFDPSFWGISVREATAMDPQQRLVMQVGWEALEEAGCTPHAPHRLDGQRVGVFVGIAGAEYPRLASRSPEALKAAGRYAALGATASGAAGRLSFHLGLCGPTMTVDTACSSSATALHAARSSLLRGECDVALVAGASVAVDPTAWLAMQSAGVLSVQGKCRPFTAMADGYVRGEGALAIVLRRASSVENGHVHAMVLSTACNNDGDLANGPAAPSPMAQAAVLRAAYAAGGVSTQDISAIEAHGSGTLLGDAIELEALQEVFGEQPILLGSAKAIVGHLEAAAGLAGVFKAVLALQHRAWPPQPSDAPTSGGTTRAQIPYGKEPVSWVTQSRPRVCGVSSFGLTGTNVHMVLAEAPTIAPVVPDQGPLALFASARSKKALEHTLRYWKRVPDVRSQLATHAYRGEQHTVWRVPVVASDIPSFHRALDQALVSLDQPLRYRKKIAFVYTGMGGWHANASVSLYEQHPVFRQAADACMERIAQEEQCTLRVVQQALFYGGTWDPVIQPHVGLFVVSMAMTSLWKALGCSPHVVVGHSAGEVVATWASGALTLDQAVQLMLRRSRLLCNQGGAMMMVRASATSAVVRRALEQSKGQVVVAAMNSPMETVLSGPRDVLAKLPLDGKWLKVSTAFHSSIVHKAALALEEQAPTTKVPHTQWISSTIGALVPSVLPPSHWRLHATEPVRWMDAVEAARASGVEMFVECGPRSILTALTKACVGESAVCIASGTQRKGEEDGLCWLKAVGDVWSQASTMGTPLCLQFHQLGMLKEEWMSPSSWKYPWTLQSCWLPGLDNKVHPAIDLIPLVPSVEPSIVDTTPTLSVQPLERVWIETPLNVKERVLQVMMVARSEEWTLGERQEWSDDAVVWGTRLLSKEWDKVVIVSTGDKKDIHGIVSLLQALHVVHLMQRASTQLVVIAHVVETATMEDRAQLGAIQGLVRAALVEYPEIVSGLWTVEGSPDTTWLSKELQSTDAWEVAWSQGSRRVPRVMPVEMHDAVPVPSGTLVVIGGMAGAAVPVVNWWSHAPDPSSRHVVLTTRRISQDTEPIQSWKALGLHVHVVVGDPSTLSTLSSALNALLDTLPPLVAVVHVAGTVSRVSLDSMSEQVWTSTLAPKLGGALVAEALVAKYGGYAIMFSSCAGVWGDASGLAHYAAANAAVDAVAQAMGPERATSIAWGVLQTGGMTTAQVMMVAREFGMHPMTNEDMEHTMEHVWATRGQHLLHIASRMDWKVFGKMVDPVVREHVCSIMCPSIVKEESMVLGLLKYVGALDLLSMIQSEVASELGTTDLPALTWHTSLYRIGLDSISVVRIGERFGQMLGVHVSRVFRQTGEPLVLQQAVERHRPELWAVCTQHHCQPEQDPECAAAAKVMIVPGTVEEQVWSALVSSPASRSSVVHTLPRVLSAFQSSSAIALQYVCGMLGRKLKRDDPVEPDELLVALEVDMPLTQQIVDQMVQDTGIVLHVTTLWQGATARKVAKALSVAAIQNIETPFLNRDVLDTPWLMDLTLSASHDTARSVLFVFPLAGGNPALFRSWALHLPHVRVIGVHLPGRTLRFGERPMTDMARIAEEVAGPMARAAQDLPFALYGHCAGALMAFATTRVLRKEKLKMPSVLMVACSPPPHRRNPNLPGEEAGKVIDAGVGDHVRVAAKATPGSHLQEEGPSEHNLALGRSLIRLFGEETGADFFSGDGAFDEWGHIIAADITTIDKFTPCPEEEPLSIPIHAFGGTEDKFVGDAEEVMSGWKEHTTAGFRLDVVEGGHMLGLPARAEKTPKITQSEFLKRVHAIMRDLQ